MTLFDATRIGREQTQGRRLHRDDRLIARVAFTPKMLDTPCHPFRPTGGRYENRWTISFSGDAARPGIVRVFARRRKRTSTKRPTRPPTRPKTPPKTRLTPPRKGQENRARHRQGADKTADRRTKDAAKDTATAPRRSSQERPSTASKKPPTRLPTRPRMRPKTPATWRRRPGTASRRA